MFYMFYVFFLMSFFSNLYLYNTVLSVLFCVNKDIIIIIILINNFCYHGFIPDKLKLARVVPIFNAGDSPNKIIIIDPFQFFHFSQKYMND